MDGDSDDAWRRALGDATRSAARITATEPKARLEAPLVALWKLMTAAPHSVANAFERLDENDLETAAEARAGELSILEPRPFAPLLESPTADLVRQLAVEIRALDQALFWERDTVRPDDAEAYLSLDGSAFVIPRPAAQRPSRRRGQMFNRRGLACHRILPTEIQGLRVTLLCQSTLERSGAGDEADVVAAMFEDLKLKIQKAGADFHVVGLGAAAKVRRALDAQLDALRENGPCLCVVWPELSLPDALHQRLVQALQDEPLSAGVVVAGSWHRKKGEQWFNVAPVLDGFGSPLLEVVKRQRYQLKSGELEGIETGSVLPVLSHGSVLIAFAICKDFCDARAPTPYGLLDVDYVLTPSFGDRATMDAHVLAAKAISVGHGARAFVVQQNRDGGTPPWGEVLWPSPKPRGSSTRAEQRKPLERKKVACKG